MSKEKLFISYSKCDNEFKTLRKSIAKLHRYEQMAEDGTFEVLATSGDNHLGGDD